MRKTIAFSVLAVAALLVSAVPALAQEPEPDVLIIPNCDGPPGTVCANYFEVTTDQSIGLYWGWYAATKGLIRVFLGHTTETLTLLDKDKKPVWGLTAEQLRAKYNPIRQYDSYDFFGPGTGSLCPMPWIYVADANWNPPELVPGTYTLTWTASFDQPVNDAIHACKTLRTPEGFIPTPSLSRGDFSFVKTIVVSAAGP
jgi:hypothetical protein